MTTAQVIDGKVADTAAEVELAGRRDATYYGPVWAAAGRYWVLCYNQAIEVTHVRQNVWREAV